MKKQSIKTVAAILLVAILMLCIGVACNSEKEPGTTVAPSGNAVTTASANTTANTDATQKAEPATTPGEDNEVTFPSEWGGWNGAPDKTQKPTQEPTKDSVTGTEAISGTGSQAQTAMPNATESVATPTVSDSPKPTADSTPIGTDADGWIDKWY